MITTEELVEIQATLEWAATRHPLVGKIPRQIGAVAREIERRRTYYAALRRAIPDRLQAKTRRDRDDALRDSDWSF